RTLAATDGADRIVPGADGRSLEVTWRRFAVVGEKPGLLVEPGFEVSTIWRIDGPTLTRTETLTAARDVTIARLSWLLSSTATSHSQGAQGGVRVSGPDGALDVRTS